MITLYLMTGDLADCPTENTGSQDNVAGFE